jgi:hypothetical protein
LLGTGSTSPYTNTWIPNIYATYSITATANDVGGNSWVSAPLFVNVGDGYGTPLGWYLQYGFNPFTPGLGTEDPEMEGLFNYQYYLYGISPTNAIPLSIWIGTPSATTSIP